VLALAFVVIIGLSLLPAAVGKPVVYGVQTATAGAAFLGMVRAARRAAGTLHHARALTAGGLLCGATGGLLAVLGSLLLGPRPLGLSVVDVVSLATGPLFVAALLRYPTSSDTAGSRLRVLLDGAGAATALWFFLCALLPGTMLVSEQGAAALAVRLAYPVSDVFVLGMIVSVLAQAGAPVRREVRLLGAGMAC